jgi:hypothetical protein
MERAADGDVSEQAPAAGTEIAILPTGFGAFLSTLDPQSRDANTCICLKTTKPFFEGPLIL